MGLSIVDTLRAAGCVYAEDEARLLTEAASNPAELSTLVDRRVAGEPLEYVLGWAEFYGLRIAVEPGVFVPRRRTEYLIEQALALGPAYTVVDLCCGAGALGAALAAQIPDVDVYAVDLDPVAVRCARRNLPDGHVYEGDLYDPLPHRLHGHVDVIVANVPYVPTHALDLLPADARLFEPDLALDGGPDGLTVLRRVAADAPKWLRPGGHLLIEVSDVQAPAALVGFAGLDAWVATDGEDTVVIGRVGTTRSSAA